MGDQVSYPKGLFYAIIVLLVFTTAMVTVALLLTGEIPIIWIIVLGGFMALEIWVSGITPLRGGISSEGGVLNVRMGMLFRMSIPLDQLESVDVFTGKMPLHLRYGVHLGPKKTVAAITSMKRIITIKTKGPVRGYLHGFPVRVLTVFLRRR
jgi:hypothetical protein